ncbi:MAG: class I SAM-dependent methyltransferase [Fuerstiella sp.]
MNCYDWPQYWDLAFDDDTQLEADFIDAAGRKYCSFPVKRLLEPGCGGGRLVFELARRGYDVSACDLSVAAVEFARARLAAADLTADVTVNDMRDLSCEPIADVAYCLVNTFRHLLTESDAARHLQAVADSVRSGGLYLIGMHLLPPDADEEDSEEWSVSKDETTVNMRLDVAQCDRATRLETLKFRMEAVTSDAASPQLFETDYQMRIYRAHQFEELIKRVPEFELLDVYDFWYDIEEPLQLSDEMGDTVFVLRRI